MIKTIEVENFGLLKKGIQIISSRLKYLGNLTTKLKSRVHLTLRFYLFCRDKAVVFVGFKNEQHVKENFSVNEKTFTKKEIKFIKGIFSEIKVEKMSRQVFLDRYIGDKFEVDEKILRILNWNIRNPSYHRAIKQCKYIEKLKPHIILLTELKSPNGLKYFKERFSYLGYNLFYDFPKDDYFILIACVFDSYEMQITTDFLPHRMKGIYFKYKDIEGKFFGIYVPSRGPKEKRNVNKRKFQDSVMMALDEIKKVVKTSKLIAGGDLNVIDPYHIPKYPIFGDWEYEFYKKFIEIGLIDAFRKVNFHQDYSWFGREGDGYRFDHLFVSTDLENRIKSCYYDHSVRYNKLSDHSAMILELEL